MELKLEFDILPQPDDVTCGPTCLDAIYRYYGDEMPLARVIAETPQLENGGTFAVHLARHALRRGYSAILYTYNLQIFDPTWFTSRDIDLVERLQAQSERKKDVKLRIYTQAYLDYLQLGGKIRFVDLSTRLIRRYLLRRIPILTGLSSTYLYREAREYGPQSDNDDIRGEPAGHFVVLCGYSPLRREVLVADPLITNPLFGTNQYWINVDRVLAAILLGILTYDGNLLILKPK